MIDNELRKKILIGMSIFIGFIAVSSFIFWIFSITTPKENLYVPEVTTVIDPGTGEVIVEVESKTPEINGLDDIVSISGLQELLNYGMKYDQLNILQLDYQDYSDKQNPKIKYISVDENSIKSSSIDPKTGAITLTYKIYLERDSSRYLNCKVRYTTVKSTTLTITDKSGKIVYKSS